MNKKIGIDLDGILAAYQKQLVSFVNEKYGTNYKFNKISRDDCYDILGSNILSRFIKLTNFYFFSGSLSNIEPVQGAVSAVKKLKKQGNKLYIVTSRFWGFSRRTNLWLEKYFGKNTFEKVVYSKILSIHSSRFKISKYKKLGVDFIIEDSPRVAMDCSGRGIKVLLMDYSWNRDARGQGITRVKDWKHALKKIKELNHK